MNINEYDHVFEKKDIWISDKCHKTSKKPLICAFIIRNDPNFVAKNIDNAQKFPFNSSENIYTTHAKKRHDKRIAA